MKNLKINSFIFKKNLKEKTKLGIEDSLRINS